MHERSIAPCVRRNQRKAPAAAAPRRGRAGLRRVPRRAALASIDDVVAGLTSARPCRLPHSDGPVVRAVAENPSPRVSIYACFFVQSRRAHGYWPATCAWLRRYEVDGWAFVVAGVSAFFTVSLRFINQLACSAPISIPLYKKSYFRKCVLVGLRLVIRRSVIHNRSKSNLTI